MIAGKATGAAKSEALTAASTIPVFLSLRKNRGVGFCTLSLIVIVYDLMIK